MENENMATIWHGSREGFYCRYSGEHSQSHLKQSRPNMTSRLNRAMRGMRWSKNEEREGRKRDQQSRG